jgi:Protein of unknown function (DUF2380)
LICDRIVALALAFVLLPAAAHAAPKAIIFPFDLIDQQQQFELGVMPKGIDPEEKRRLELITKELTKLIKESGRYDVLDPAPIAAEIEEKAPIYKCNGCEDDLAKKAGADVVFVGIVRKASDVLFTVSVFIRDIAKEKVIKQASSEIYGNTDAMWLRAVHYIVDRRLFKEKEAKAKEGASQ